MNPFILVILRSVAIRVVGMIAASLVAANLMTLEQFESIREHGVTLILSILVTVATIGWSVLVKYWDRVKLLVAMRVKVPVTEQQIEQLAKSPFAPAVSTAKDQVL